MSFIIREATREDANSAFNLIHGLAVHEEVDEHLHITAEQFTEAAFGGTPRFNILIAEEHGKVVGIATYMRRYMVWFGEDIIHIDDLFVKPSARGHGIGNKLLEAIGLMGKKEGVHVQWHIERENFSTIAFYKRKGVNYQTKGVCLWAPEDMNFSE